MTKAQITDRSLSVFNNTNPEDAPLFSFNLLPGEKADIIANIRAESANVDGGFKWGVYAPGATFRINSLRDGGTEEFPTYSQVLTELGSPDQTGNSLSEHIILTGSIVAGDAPVTVNIGMAQYTESPIPAKFLAGASLVVQLQ